MYDQAEWIGSQRRRIKIHIFNNLNNTIPIKISDCSCDFIHKEYKDNPYQQIDEIIL